MTLEDYCTEYEGTYELRFLSEDGEVMAKVSGQDLDSVLEQSNKLELAISQSIVEEYNDKYEVDYDSWAKEERMMNDGL